jgi:hypothetical protein
MISRYNVLLKGLSCLASKNQEMMDIILGSEIPTGLRIVPSTFFMLTFLILVLGKEVEKLSTALDVGRKLAKHPKFIVIGTSSGKSTFLDIILGSEIPTGRGIVCFFILSFNHSLFFFFSSLQTTVAMWELVYAENPKLEVVDGDEVQELQVKIWNSATLKVLLYFLFFSCFIFKLWGSPVPSNSSGSVVMVFLVVLVLHVGIVILISWFLFFVCFEFTILAFSQLLCSVCLLPLPLKLIFLGSS